MSDTRDIEKKYAGRCRICDYSPDTPTSIYHHSIMDPINIRGNKMVTWDMCAKCETSHKLTWYSFSDPQYETEQREE